jgi:hypothetical protein
MCRIRFLLLLLPLLAGCATRHAAPNLADVPIPALFYAAVLDGETVTPIQSPIIVKYAPYPTASFERLARGAAAGDGRTVSLSTRTAGTTFAKSSGDFVAITFAIEEVTVSGNAQATEKDALSLKGTKISLLFEPFGPLKDVRVYLPPSSGSATKSEAIEQGLRHHFATEVLLPKEGFHQGDTISIDLAVPTTSGNKDSTFSGKATVQGRGTYRGRPVVLFQLAGVAVIDEKPFGLNSYLLLDTATGIWSHMETVAEGTFSSGDKTAHLEVHLIDDVRF